MECPVLSDICVEPLFKAVYIERTPGFAARMIGYGFMGGVPVRSLSSLAKGMNVLGCFTIETPEWGVRDLASHLGYPRSTVQMLLNTLANAGLLMRTENRRYRLGWGLFDLAGVFLAQLELRKVALPIMQNLAEMTGEIIHMGVLDGGQVIYVEKVEGRKSIPLITRLGFRYPAHCTGIGKLLLAYVDQDELKVELTPLTPNTHVDPQALQKELLQIRAKGVAYDREEAVVGLSCVAAPIRDFTGEVIAGVSISAPTVRFVQKEQQWMSLVCTAAAEISSQMGYLKNVTGYQKNRCRR